MDNICVLGLGYIGLPTAAMFATHGVKVHGVDINDKIIEILNNGDIHIEEPGLKKLVQTAIESGNFNVDNQPRPADAFIIAVPTPFKHDEYDEYQGKRYKLADMRAVISAAKSIVPYLGQGNLVILESTSPPKTTIELVAPILEKSGLKAGEDFYLAYSPERVLPGQILQELIGNDRVIGGINQASAKKGKELYSTFVRGDILLTDANTAEMVKLMENTYRDVNIALANEFSRLADRFGVNVWEAIETANQHPRVNILNPGPGVGGHCISVDPWFLVESAPDLSKLIFQARQVNDSQPKFVLEKIRMKIGKTIKGKKIAVLGLTYKPDVDDMRESPAVEVVLLLVDAGAIVKVFEPHLKEKIFNGITTTTTLEEAVKDAEIIVLLVGHEYFKNIKPNILDSITSANLIIDIVNGWNSRSFSRKGFRFFKL